LKLRNKVGYPCPTISFVCIRFERVFFENRDNGVPNGFALSLALSHGEREQMAGNHNNGRISVI